MPKDIVLCVDDEPTVLQACSNAVAVAGFRAVTAENGADGLEAFKRLQDEICLVLSDIVMPVLSGIDMAESIRQIDPQAKILLMSGYSDAILESRGRSQYPFIRKPFIHGMLIERIRSIRDNPDSAASAC